MDEALNFSLLFSYLEVETSKKEYQVVDETIKSSNELRKEVELLRQFVSTPSCGYECVGYTRT